MEKESITIPLDEYIALTRDSEFLDRLRAAGVDNWEGYEHAQESED